MPRAVRHAHRAARDVDPRPAGVDQHATRLAGGPVDLQLVLAAGGRVALLQHVLAGGGPVAGEQHRCAVPERACAGVEVVGARGLQHHPWALGAAARRRELQGPPGVVGDGPDRAAPEGQRRERVRATRLVDRRAAAAWSNEYRSASVCGGSSGRLGLGRLVSAGWVLAGPVLVGRRRSGRTWRARLRRRPLPLRTGWSSIPACTNSRLCDA